MEIGAMTLRESAVVQRPIVLMNGVSYDQGAIRGKLARFGYDIVWPDHHMASPIALFPHFVPVEMEEDALNQLSTLIQFESRNCHCHSLTCEEPERAENGLS